MAWEDENDEVRDINDGYVMSMPCIRELHGLCGALWCVCHCHEEDEPDWNNSTVRAMADLSIAKEVQRVVLRPVGPSDAPDGPDLTKHGQNGL